jgi:xylulokinase
MKTNETILIIDVGTTSIKISLFDSCLNIIDVYSEEYQLITKDQRIEFDALIYWMIIKKGIRFLTSKYSTLEVKAISVTTQGETLIPVDQQGNPLSNAIIWMDHRADQQALFIKSKISALSFYQITGIPSINGYCPLSKLLWFKEESNEIYQKAQYFLSLEDFIVYQLTKIFISEKSLMSTTGYFNLLTDTLWDDVFEHLDLDPRKIPYLNECGEEIGKIREELHKELGLSKNTIVYSGIMDQVSSALGSGNIEPGMITETTGTALCIGLTLTQDPSLKTIGIARYRHYEAKKELILAVSMTAGMALKWFKDQFCQEEINKAKLENYSVYDLLDQQVSVSPPLSNGVVFLPYLEGSLQPLENEQLRGAFLNIGLKSTKNDFTRALYEGVAYMLRENIDLMKKLYQLEFEEIISIGGGSHSMIWNQIKADVCQCRIKTLNNGETTALGTAILCAVKLGYYDSLEEAIEKCVKQKDQFDLNITLKEKYQEGYNKYKDYLTKVAS